MFTYPNFCFSFQNRRRFQVVLFFLRVVFNVFGKTQILKFHYGDFFGENGRLCFSGLDPKRHTVDGSEIR